MRIRLYGDVSHETYCRAFLYVVMSQMTDLIISITLLLIISIRVSLKWVHINCIDIRVIIEIC